MKGLLVSLQAAGLLLAAGALSAQEAPASEDAAAAGFSASVTTMAMVDAIDLTTREVTLRKDDGEIVVIVAGPEVQRLGEIGVGDVVLARYDLGFVLAVGPPGSEPSLLDETEILRTPQGDSPGGVVRRTVAVTATVVEIDAERRIVTLRGPQRTVALPVADAVDLSRLAVGDRVGAAYEESLAILVEKVEE